MESCHHHIGRNWIRRCKKFVSRHFVRLHFDRQSSTYCVPVYLLYYHHYQKDNRIKKGGGIVSRTIPVRLLLLLLLRLVVDDQVACGCNNQPTKQSANKSIAGPLYTTTPSALFSFLFRDRDRTSARTKIKRVKRTFSLLCQSQSYTTCGKTRNLVYLSSLL